VFSMILSWLTGGGIAAIGRELNTAYQNKLTAQNDGARIAADVQIKVLEARLEAYKTNASVIQSAMQHKVFWVAWAIAAIPTVSWFGWGMLDSLFNGALPDVAALPPQLKEYADTVWNSLFLSGGAVATASVVASAIRGRK